ncbi:MAG: hypothetical protein M3P27_01795 [Acidobacteriota bacterium]|nr:hypothetical protein [Acidobacteriota bacterium]
MAMKQKKNGRPDGKPNGNLNKVVKIAPERPEARDEGPRLIPLDEKPTSQKFGRRALELADIALGLREPQPKRHPKK